MLVDCRWLDCRDFSFLHPPIPFSPSFFLLFKPLQTGSMEPRCASRRMFASGRTPFARFSFSILDLLFCQLQKLVLALQVARRRGIVRFIIARPYCLAGLSVPSRSAEAAFFIRVLTNWRILFAS